MAKLVKWKAGTVPTGRFRSFDHRTWPSAFYVNDEIAAYISCEDAYIPAIAKSGEHGPLTLRIADHSVTPWVWKKATVQYKTLDEAKAAFDRLIERFPHMKPKG